MIIKLIELYRKLGISKNQRIHKALIKIAESFLRIVPFFGGIKIGEYACTGTAFEMVFGTYEAKFCKLLPNFIKEGDVVVDVGANIGYFSRRYSRYAGPNGRVICFEPNPRIFRILQKNTEKLKNVECYNLALSDNDGQMDLYVADHYPNEGSLVPGYAPQFRLLSDPRGKYGKKIEKFKVNLVEGSPFFLNKGIKEINFLKVDVEGWEINVLNGLRPIIQNSPMLTMFVELNLFSLKLAGHSPNDLLNLIFELKFKAYYVKEETGLVGLSPSNIEMLVNSLGDTGYTDLVCEKGNY